VSVERGQPENPGPAKLAGPAEIPAVEPEERRTAMKLENASVVGNGSREPNAGSRERLTREDRALLFRYMLLMRLSEERGLTLYKQGKVPGSFYDGRGQEAISVGASFVLGAEIASASCTAILAPISSAG